MSNSSELKSNHTLSQQPLCFVYTAVLTKSKPFYPYSINPKPLINHDLSGYQVLRLVKTMGFKDVIHLNLTIQLLVTIIDWEHNTVKLWVVPGCQTSSLVPGHHDISSSLRVANYKPSWLHNYTLNGFSQLQRSSRKISQIKKMNNQKT